MDLLPVKDADLYDELGIHGKDRDELERLAAVISRYEKRTIDDLMIIGEALQQAREFQPHGTFTRWVARKFPH